MYTYQMENTILPTVLVIFGATGDLMARMVAPALLQLLQKNKLPEQFRIIAFSRRDFDDQMYREYLLEKMHHIKSIPVDVDASPLLSTITYHKGTFDSIESYRNLSLSLSDNDTLWNICANKLFYLPIPPEYYPVVLENLSASGLTDPCGIDEGWTRVLVEKPFGKNLESALKLEEQLKRLFQEEQIYRIDHYLAKETVQNILSFRFSNRIFEPALHKDYVAKIHLRLNETLGLDDRGDFFDGLGSLRDVGANHLLQVAALLMMDKPRAFDAAGIRESRAKFLQSIVEPTRQSIPKNTKRGQYKGYTQIEGVSPHSQTETYFCIELASLQQRWHGVPIILEGGKKRPLEQKDVTIFYQAPIPSYIPPDETDVQDFVRFDLTDKERIELSLMFRQPSHETAFQRNTLHYHTYGNTERNERLEEYEFVLLDAIRGDQMRFVSTEEVRAMWKIIDPIVEAWDQNVVPLEIY